MSTVVATDNSLNPCIGCGVCCTGYRISFHWTESTADPQGWVPIELTEPLRRHELAMRGTSATNPRCIALAGTVGIDAHCSIHGRHPSCCRAVDVGSDQCMRARARHGFEVLDEAVILHARAAAAAATASSSITSDGIVRHEPAAILVITPAATSAAFSPDGPSATADAGTRPVPH